jgi:hypothetical protein
MAVGARLVMSGVVRRRQAIIVLLGMSGATPLGDAETTATFLVIRR